MHSRSQGEVYFGYTHDKSGRWGKERTLAKLRGYVYWPNQSEDVAKYIAGCIEYARHKPALRSQPLHLVHVIHSMLLLGMDWVGPLPVTKSGMVYIFHVICYFSRFFFTFASPIANSTVVIRFLGILFVRYHKPLAIYCDRGQHFDSEKTKVYL